MKIVTVIGARPQIIKASALSRTIRGYYNSAIKEIVVHTGQHYDEKMSDIFFSELEIPLPDYNLNIGSGLHGEQTAKMITGIERILLKEQPKALVIYGDTNSTLAGAIAASKTRIPIIHIEAGLRSFDKTMPEEINRVLADNVSTLLFCPTKTGYNNLIKEGFSPDISVCPNFNTPNVYYCGDIMLDNTLYFKDIALNNSDYRKRFGEDFILCTVHRDTNTDSKEKLSNIFSSLLVIAQKRRIILPLHPRTRKMIPQMLSLELQNQLYDSKNIEIIEPVGYLEMIYLESMSNLIITDSGGVQKEAYFLGKPCIILRPRTEWVEIVQMGVAIITDTDKEKIMNAYDKLQRTTFQQIPALFGDGKASEFICKTILETLT
ncbi:MAG: non-hydrolyzing UDP-N-acetylglucosamine 2-epimerase [Bacteroidales bacterium]